MKLRVAKSFNRWRYHSTRSNQAQMHSRKLAVMIYERKLLPLARYSPAAALFHQWKMRSAVQGAFDQKKNKLQSEYEKLQSTV